MRMNHISQFSSVKIKTPPVSVRDKGLIMQSFCIGKSSDKSRILIIWALIWNAVQYLIFHRQLYLLLK